MPSLGAVDYMGVQRQWKRHATFNIYLVRGMPGYPTALLKGDETGTQLSKPWMLSVKRKDTQVVVATGFFLTEQAAVTALKAELQTRLGVSQAVRDRIVGTLNLSGVRNIHAYVRKFRKIDPDADDT